MTPPTTRRLSDYAKAKVAVSVVIFLTGGIVHADRDAAQRQLQELYVFKFDCLGAGQGSAKCSALENAYTAAGFGDLAADATGGLTVLAFGHQYGTMYTITLPEGRLALTICGIPAVADRVALFGLNSDLSYLRTEFQVPQIAAVDANRCATFTAPFTTSNYLDDGFGYITVETFAMRMWMLDVRIGSSSYEQAIFTIP